jgi:hypothetical protein
MMQKITPFLWFDAKAEEASALCCTLTPRRRGCIAAPAARREKSVSPVRGSRRAGGWGLPYTGEPTVRQRGWPLRC